MIKYKAEFIAEPIITKINIIKETKECVFIGYPGYQMRRSKISTGEGYFNTWQEAFVFLCNEQIQKIKRLESQIEYHESKINEIKKLNPF
jgi:hypothetical protein